MEQPTRRNRNKVAGIAFATAAILTVLMALRARHETMIILGQEKSVNDAIQAVLDSENIGFAIMDDRQRIIEWNPALERLSGWTKEAVRERGLEPLMGKEQWLKHQTAFAKAMQAGNTKRTAVVECEIPEHDDNKGIPIRITVRLVKTHSGVLYSIAHIDRKSRVVEIKTENQ
jgi:PAS domain S-box-containing protein